VRLLVGLLVCFAAAPLRAPLAAQRNSVKLEIALPAPTALGTDGPAVATANLLADDKTRQLLRSGFPTRIHYRLELWHKRRWFDDPEGRTEWDVLVLYDPTVQRYTVQRTHDNELENFGGFATVTSADVRCGVPYRPGLHPKKSGTYYYNLIVDVQTLTESDLDALQQWWLHGPSAPGKSNPVTTIRSGLGVLLSRVLGGDKRHYEARTGEFAVR
jgi:hypothetical protein